MQLDKYNITPAQLSPEQFVKEQLDTAMYARAPSKRTGHLCAVHDVMLQFCITAYVESGEERGRLVR